MRETYALRLRATTLDIFDNICGWAFSHLTPNCRNPYAFPKEDYIEMLQMGGAPKPASQVPGDEADGVDGVDGVRPRKYFKWQRIEMECNGQWYNQNI